MLLGDREGVGRRRVIRKHWPIASQHALGKGALGPHCALQGGSQGKGKRAQSEAGQKLTCRKKLLPRISH